MQGPVYGINKATVEDTFGHAMQGPIYGNNKALVEVTYWHTVRRPVYGKNKATVEATSGHTVRRPVYGNNSGNDITHTLPSQYYEDWAGDLLGALTHRSLACSGGCGALLALI